MENLQSMDFSVDNRPNLSNAVTYDSYRKTVDALFEQEDGGEKPMPRTGVFNEEDYENILSDPRTVFADDGMPLVGAYDLAYPHANTEQFPELKQAGYLMYPLSKLDGSQKEKIVDSSFSLFVGEVVNPRVINYAKAWEIVEEQLDTLYSTNVGALKQACLEVDWGVAEPFDGDGRPIVHHLIELDVSQKIVHKPTEGIIDDFEDKSIVLPLVSSIASHHIDAFSQHSMTATLVHLDHANEIVTMLMDPSWNAVAHTTSGIIDCAAVITRDKNNTPWIDPMSIKDRGLFAYVDSISTSESARRSGLALGVLVHALSRYANLARGKNNQSLLIPFDTAGESTYSVPRLAKAVFDTAGLDILTGRVDVLGHILINRNIKRDT